MKFVRIGSREKTTCVDRGHWQLSRKVNSLKWGIIVCLDIGSICKGFGIGRLTLYKPSLSDRFSYFIVDGYL